MTRGTGSVERRDDEDPASGRTALGLASFGTPVPVPVATSVGPEVGE
jgi:hypothetical protein